jgi:hypothetical protein
MQNLAFFGSLMFTNPIGGKKSDPGRNEYGIGGVQSNEGEAEFIASPFRIEGGR